MKRRRNRQALGVAALALGLALAAGAALAQGPVKQSARPPAPRFDPDSVIAVVGGRPVSRAEFKSRYDRQSAQYSARAGADLAPEFVPIAKRQVLEGLIQRELLQLEAERKGDLATEREAEEEMKRDPFFQRGGVFDARMFDALKTNQPRQFQDAIQKMRGRVGARRIQERLERELAPPAGELRAKAERELTRASVSYLAVSKSEFSGDYAEPTEAQVLAEYQAQRVRLTRPERARLTISFLNTPAPTDAERQDPASLKAWTDRMRAEAQKALAAIRAGTPLEDATIAFGTPRRDIVVARDNFPGYWRGDERMNDLLFSQPPGAVLPEPVPADRGFLLVRVEERTPAQVTPLAEAAPRIRKELRERARRKTQDDELMPTYMRLRDSLRTTAYRVRYAVADTGRIPLSEPTPADLERYYRAHLADYSAFDAATTSVRARPLDEVRGEVRQRWLRERRVATAREAVARIEAAWRKGKRERAAESMATLVREVGPVVAGAPADTGAAGKALGDSLTRRTGALGVGTGPSPHGPMVFDVLAAVPGYVPTFEQAQAVVSARYKQEREREEERGARELYDQDPARFAGGKLMRLSRMTVQPPDIIDVPLTRAEVERYHQEHMDRYSSPETVRARHILISPSGPGAEADERARARAMDILRRIRAGEDFAELARRYTEDPATQANGGELGSFARGAMLEEFERAAFSLRVGEISDLVRTKEGYHIIQCMGRETAYAQPLVWMYGNVGADAALEKGERISRTRADSLYLVAGTPAKLRAAARKLDLPVVQMTHTVGNRSGVPHLVDVLATLETLKPGELYPGPHRGVGKEYCFSWVDSFAPPPAPRWVDARERAIAVYRQGAGRRAFDAKIAELDSLERAGFGFDSLGALWGGLEQIPTLERGKGLPRLKGTQEVDSLVFGGAQPPALAPGRTSAWLDLPSAKLRVRLDQRIGPTASELATRVEAIHRSEMDRKLYGYFMDLKRRYPVRILDPELRDVGLPEPRER